MAATSSARWWPRAGSELLLGRPPFSRPDLAVILRRIIGGGSLTPGDLALTVPPALDQVLTTALVAAPKGRYPDLRQFWAALTAAVAAP